MIEKPTTPLATLKRFSLYYNLLQGGKGVEWVSTSMLSLKTGIKPITIRKDIGYLSIKGVPQKGYPKKQLLSSLKSILGGDSYGDIILIGTWGLGRIFLDTPELIPKEFNILVCFDFIEDDEDRSIPVYSIDRLKDLIPRLGVSMAILSVEPHRAQETCDKLFSYGIEGVLNMTNSKLDVKDGHKIVNYNLTKGLSELLGVIKS